MASFGDHVPSSLCPGQDLDQRDVIPQQLWRAGRYAHTSFLKLGRCSQYPHVAHQWAQAPDTRRPSAYNVTFLDLHDTSCLNGWTMGNIATTAEDLARFFYDVHVLAPTGSGFVNASSLAAMTDYHPLSDKWCFGPTGSGSCMYGMGFMKDQMGQDVWPMLDPNADADLVRVSGHPGEDWGSGVSPCGYNLAYGFGICIAYTSLVGMNCTADARSNANAVYEATCLAYDTVLASVGAPRLNCTLTPLHPPAQYQTCDWQRVNHSHPLPNPPHPPRPRRGADEVGRSRL